MRPPNPTVKATAAAEECATNPPSAMVISPTLRAAQLMQRASALGFVTRLPYLLMPYAVGGLLLSQPTPPTAIAARPATDAVHPAARSGAKPAPSHGSI